MGVIGQVSGRLVVEIDNVAEVDRQHYDFLVLAEFPVSHLQVGEIDPAEHLVLAHGLRIVQGGCDEILKVDVLDVEGFAHMRAARVQQLRGLLLISHTIELRLHRVRRGSHLTERQSRREDLDDERFHNGGMACVACSKRSRHGTGTR
jgi:hypothetical protein